MPRWRLMLLPVLAAGGLLTGCAGEAGWHGPPADARTARSPDSASVSPSNAGTHRGSIAAAGCVRPQLRAAYAGGGPAAGYVSVVLRFTNIGAACRLAGWPQVVGLNGNTRVTVSRHLLVAPAFVDGRIAGPLRLVLHTGDSAYLVVDGTDVGRARTCPAPYRRFEVRLPGVASAFDLPARVPGAWDYFPACVPLTTSPVLPATEIIPQQR